MRRRIKRDLVEAIEKPSRSGGNEAAGRVLRAGALAMEIGDLPAMSRAGALLQQYGMFDEAWRLRIASERLVQAPDLPEWNGDNLSGRTLLIRPNIFATRVGQDIRYCRFIAPAARRARRCIVLAEPRMVPILRRSFEGVDVRPYGVDDAAAYAEADVAAGFGTLAARFAGTAEDLARALVPLRPDLSLVGAFRERYRAAAAGPLVGLSWSSSKTHRELPDLESWAPLLRAGSATFISLQYGDVAADVATLTAMAEGRFVHDPTVDQLVDLDSFAAQIAALDAVVSITNTTIDMAASLAVPTVQIRGDKFYGMWPRSGPSPWYPAVVPVYRRHRPWPTVIEELRDRVAGLIEEREGAAELSAPS